MGTRTFINFASSSKNGKPRRSGYDLLLLGVIIALCAFGLLMVYSASWDFSLSVYNDPTYMFNRQVLWLALGICVALTLSRLDYHKWRSVVVPTMIVTIIMLVGVLIINEVRLGATRTLTNGSIQPSELAKVVTVIYLSVWMYSKRQYLQDINLGLLPLAIILGIIGGLIYLQPDLSATATIFLLGGLLFFLAGGDLKQIAFLMVVAVVVGWIVVQISSTGHARFNDYLMGIQDPTQASYHVRRSLEAIVKGGWFGAGLGRATTKVTGLPVPPTDSIFAVIAEEFGVFGAAVLISLYAALIWRGLRIAHKAPDMLGSLLATGLTFWLGSEALINMMVMVGLLPFAGNALPFISAGGSNLTASLAAIGILMNIARQSGPKEATEEEWRNFNATVDLRRRNGRRSVSRSRRTPVIER
jgi:cell division protein FtsW